MMMIHDRRLPSTIVGAIERFLPLEFHFRSAMNIHSARQPVRSSTDLVNFTIKRCVRSDDFRLG